MIADSKRNSLTDLLSIAAQNPRVEKRSEAACAPPEATVVARFEEQVSRTPNAIAVELAGRSMSYRELNERANRIARYLVSRGIKPEDIVALAIPRSFEMIVGLLAVLKAGAAYLPLDPRYPFAQLRFMLDDAGAACVLTTAQAANALPECSMVVLDSPDAIAAWATLAANDLEDRDRISPLDLENAAYVIYTSGSTGVPKGVVVGHRELANYLEWAGRVYEADGGIGAPVNTPLVFDATVTSLYLPLISGKRLFLLPEERQIEALAEMLANGTDLTLVKLTPGHLTVLQNLLGERARAVQARLFVVGGEALHQQAVAFWRERVPGLRIVNEYGPTEAVVGCCIYELGKQAAASGSVPIGKPTPNTRLYVLDSDLRPVAVGDAGELCIGGSQLARGYLKRPELTAERYIVDPFGPPGSRMYRTGDQVRWSPDGNLEFLGRMDQQVKIRGFRVELGEIETILTQCPMVQSAAVTLRETSAGGNQLVAFVVPRAGLPPASHDLKNFLKPRLPEHMIPSRFHSIEALPLTVNGKVDRRALPEPGADEEDRDRYAAPRTEVERSVAEIFSQVLNHSPIGVTDDFFDMGGDSLTAVILLAQLEKRFAAKIGMSLLLNAATVGQIAALIESLQSSQDGEAAPFYVTGSNVPIFCVPGLGANVLNFRELARSLGSDHQLCCFDAAGIDDGQAPHISVEETAAYYIQQMRKAQPTGPFYIGGWSFGGWIAFEMARQLSAAGEKVGLLALLDSAAPVSISSHGLVYFLNNKVHQFFKFVRMHADIWLKSGFRATLGYAAALIGRRLASRWFEAKYKSNEPAQGSGPKDDGRLFHAQTTAKRRYRANPYDGHAVLFRTKQLASEHPEDPAIGWNQLIRAGLAIHEVPGDHSSMLTEPHVHALVDELRLALSGTNSN